MTGCGDSDSVTPDPGFSVNQDGVASIQLTPSSMHLKGIGTQVDLSAVVTLKSGQVVTGVQNYVYDPVGRKNHPVEWRSENPFVADFEEPGLLTAISAGETIVQAAIEEIASEAEVVVEAVSSLDPVDVESPIVLHVADITINPNEIVLAEPGSIAYLTCTLIYSDNLIQDEINRYYYHPSGTVSGQIAWSSSDPLIARVSSYGVVQAVSPGEVVIHAEDPWDEMSPTDDIIVIVGNE
jgi:uncharacterized protein YjdB